MVSLEPSLRPQSARRAGFVPPLLVCALTLACGAGTETVALSGATKAETVQITNALAKAGWSFSEMYVGENGLYVKNADAAFSTASFGSAITNVLFTGYGSSSCTRTFEVQPLDATGGVCGVALSIGEDGYPHGASGDFTSLAFDPSWSARGFRLRCTGGAQNCYFRTVRLELADGEGVVRLTGLDAGDITESSFTATWNPVAGAAGYRLFAWQEKADGGADGETVWCDGFTRAQAASANVSALSEEDFNGQIADSEGWSIERVYQSVQEGCVRLGTGEARGWMISPTLPECGEAWVRVRAMRYSASDGRHMPIRRVRGNVTNEVGSVELGLSMEDRFLPLPDWVKGERLEFHSVTNIKSSRAVVDEVALVSGYRPATQAMVRVASVEVAEASCQVMGLDAGEVAYAVEALGADGEVLCAATNRVTLAVAEETDEAAFEPYVLRKGAMAYGQDFSSLSELYPKDKTAIVWTNGVTLAHWALYQGGNPYSGKLSKNAGTGSVAQWYANYSDSSGGDEFALGCKTSDSVRSFDAILCVSNATGFTLARMALGYTGRQFSFVNSEPQTVTVAYRIASEPLPPSCAGDWTQIDELSFTSPVVGNPMGLDAGTVTPPSYVIPSVSVDDLRIKPNETLLLRWHRAGASNAAVLAIDDVLLTCAPAPLPTVITLR